MGDTVEHRGRFEVGARARRVDVTTGREAVLLEEHDGDTPRPLVDELLALAAARAGGRRGLGAVDPRHAAMRDAEPRGFGELVDAGGGLGCDALEKRLRAFVCG